MDDFLKLVKKPSEDQIEIDASRLKFFSSKVKIWDFARLSFTDYQKLSVEDRSFILKSYYAEICSRFPAGSGILLSFIVCIFSR